ncbi:MAG: hypothetical protein RBU30_02805 [Polyangia bacterium]|jgi:hypothetical protein|nr:hypothetical protein [Polyangia bacterium]
MTDHRDTLDGLLVEAAALALQHPSLPFPDPEDPGDELILRYLDGELDPMEREEYRQRITRSPFYRERLAALKDSIAEAEGVAPSSQAAASRPLRLSFLLGKDGLRFLFGSLAPRSLVAVPVATRGRVAEKREESCFFDFAHRFDDLDFLILLERVSASRLDLQLQLQGEPRTTRPLRVNLSNRQGAILDSQPVDGGLARFSSMPPSCHRISITDPQREIGQILLDVHLA